MIPNRGDEAVSVARNSLDVSRTFGGVTERPADFAHGRVQAVLEVYERVAGPDGLAQILAADQMIRSLDQSPKDLKGLVLDRNAGSVLSQLAANGIELERSEPVLSHSGFHYASPFAGDKAQ